MKWINTKNNPTELIPTDFLRYKSTVLFIYEY